MRGALRCGARDGNRTRTAIACRFSSHNVFRRRQLAVRALDYAFALVLSHVRRPPSSLYTFPISGLGSALPRHKGRGFAEFDGIHTGAFASRCSIL